MTFDEAVLTLKDKHGSHSAVARALCLTPREYRHIRSGARGGEADIQHIILAASCAKNNPKNTAPLPHAQERASEPAGAPDGERNGERGESKSGQAGPLGRVFMGLFSRGRRAAARQTPMSASKGT